MFLFRKWDPRSGPVGVGWVRKDVYPRKEKDRSQKQMISQDPTTG